MIRVDIGCLRKVVAERPEITEKFAELVHRRRQMAEDVRELMPDQMPEAVTLQDLVRRVDRVFRSGLR